MAWEYAIGFRTPMWFDEQNMLSRVRRRMWRRLIVDSKKFTPAERRGLKGSSFSTISESGSERVV